MKRYGHGLPIANSCPSYETPPQSWEYTWRADYTEKSPMPYQNLRTNISANLNWGRSFLWQPIPTSITTDYRQEPYYTMAEQAPTDYKFFSRTDPKYILPCECKKQ